MPSDASSEEYTLDFTVNSDETTKSGQIIIVVSPVEICEEVERAIKNYESIIKKANLEVEKAISEGRNITSALYHLSRAKTELGLAKRSYEVNDCEEAREHLKLVRENLKEFASELSKSIKPIIELAVMGIEWIIWFIIMIILFMLFILILIFKRRSRKKEADEYKKLKEKWRKRKEEYEPSIPSRT